MGKDHRKTKTVWEESAKDTNGKEKNAKSSTSKSLDSEIDEYLPQIRERRKENLITSSFFASIIVGIFITVIGSIWAIGDIFSENKFANYLELSTQSQIFIAGAILIGLFILVLFLAVIYRKGKQGLWKLLYEKKPQQHAKNVEEYLPAKIIAGGTLISFFVIFLGLIIALLGYLVNKDTLTDTSGFSEFLDGLTGGSTVLVVGLIILVFTGLILGFYYTWMNGYYFFMTRILDYNNRVNTPVEFSEKQKKIGRALFITIVVDILLIALGIVWAIVDAIAFDYAETFSSYPFGIQFSVMGLFGSGLFGLLIGAMSLYKWGNFVINNAIFGHIEPKDLEHDNSLAKIVAIGFLAGIALIFFALVVWIGSLIAAVIEGGGETNIFLALTSLSGGLELMGYTILVLIIILLVLGFLFVLNNGYYVSLKLVTRTEEALNKSLEPKKKKNDSDTEKK